MATNKLTARQVDVAKPGQYGDGGGLWLVVSPSGARRWIYRFMLEGKSSSMGLGSLSDGVSLAEARARAAQVRLAHKAGKNPIEARRDAQTASEAKMTFGRAADDLISDKEPGWRNEKHRKQWRQTLNTYCADMRSKPVGEITTADVLAVLKPIWTTKSETASRLRGSRDVSLARSRRSEAQRRGDHLMAYYVGLDLAKRSDYSALVILDAQRRQICAALRLPHADFVEQIGSIMPMLRQAKAVAVDRGGVGDAVIELLPRFLRVIPVLITGGGNVVERRGLVSVGKRPLIELIIKSGVAVAENAPGREELKAEMAAFALRVGAKGHLKMEARSGAHDDLVIAAGLAILAGVIMIE